MLFNSPLIMQGKIKSIAAIPYLAGSIQSQPLTEKMMANRQEVSLQNSSGVKKSNALYGKYVRLCGTKTFLYTYYFSINFKRKK